MNKYVVMTGRDDVVVLNADDNKSVKAYIAKGYGITNRIKSKHPLEMTVRVGTHKRSNNKNT